MKPKSKFKFKIGDKVRIKSKEVVHLELYDIAEILDIYDEGDRATYYIQKFGYDMPTDVVFGEMISELISYPKYFKFK